MRKLFVIVSILIFCYAFCSCTKENGRITGIKIYDYKGDYDQLTAKWKSMGINTCFAGESLAGNKTFRKAFGKSKKSIYVIFPVFQDPEILRKDSSLYAFDNKGRIAKSDWVEFVCPSRQKYRTSKTNELAGLIRRLDPDGISLDLIRHFVYWEMIYPDHEADSIDFTCFCDTCQANFPQEKNITIPDSCRTTAQKAEFIIHNYSEPWDIFRSDLITSMVKDLAQEARAVKPGNYNQSNLCRNENKILYQFPVFPDHGSFFYYCSCLSLSEQTGSKDGIWVV